MTMKLLRKSFCETERNSFSIVSRKTALRRGGLHRFDPLDRVDLVRAVFALALLDALEHRPQHLERENHQPGVERRRGRETPASATTL